MSLLFLLVCAVGSCLAEQPDPAQGCSQGSCYPATGDLLVGRKDKLTASSTCGLRRRQPYCIVSHLQDEKKCFICDSRKPYDRLRNPHSHRVQNVITTFAQYRKEAWWQSENGLSNVHLQLDLEAEFHFTHLIMTFKTFRPAAMLIERSADFGRTWQTYRYFSHDCASDFPNVRRGPLKEVDEVICESRYSDIEPSTEGEVIYRVLDPAIPIQDPYSPRIQNLLKITNLRVNFTKLRTLGDNLLDSRHEIKEKYYYAVYELVVRGNCFCYGHASECAPIAGVRGDIEGMVHGRCVCKHNTNGLNCEKCDDFYNELPWKPAEGRSTNACKRCNCNRHSSRCHFDMAVYLATGNMSGGVCDDCLHNTMGRNCEMCKPFYYQDPTRDIRDPRACVPCDCDPDGSMNGGLCDSREDTSLRLIPGQCRCKEHVEGSRCDRCKAGYFGLSVDNPQGCQSCRCHPVGTVSGNQPCDPVSGDCFCKRLVTGRRCDRCLEEHWALSQDPNGCRSCNCDVGAALDNNCSTETGQCRCRKHLMGRQCEQVMAGYFLPALDYLTYEAEIAHFRMGVTAVSRERSGHRPVTWTGSGFAKVPERGVLEFQINNIPYSMEYDLVIRYESQFPGDWEKVFISIVRPGPIPTSSPCGNTIPADDMLFTSLPSGFRYVVLPQPICLERSVSYTIRLDFKRYHSRERDPNTNILVDSIVVVPRYSSLEMFIAGDAASIRRKEAFERYRCHSDSISVVTPMVTEVCAQLIGSMSAAVYNGALPCQCDPQGALSSECAASGGQCRCKPNVVGRRCHQCAPGTFGFGPVGCRACSCSREGSVSMLCEPVSGQCPCRAGAFGTQCSQCQPGHWGFPHCQPCQCNGHADHCHQQTGVCLNCRSPTAGTHCERCAEGYYGNPLLGSGEQCRPCPCPGVLGSGRNFANSCYQDSRTRQVLCNCQPGYTGSRCEQCAAGYYGNPLLPGGRCEPCQCHGNIDVSNPQSCDRETGRCLTCLYNTDGPHCELCKMGFYGNARQHNCRQCTCNQLGTAQNQCRSREECNCDPKTGQCLCLPNVIGQNCDHCVPSYWNLRSGSGCLPCNCAIANSFSATCNEFSGQCQCRPGFGGRTCTDCQENYWGDPNVQCRVCDCEQRGVQTRQCDRITGHCVCRLGISGVRCDTCARGFWGEFPDCHPCHQCFGDWDRVVQDLVAQTRLLAERAREIQISGVAGLYEKNFRELEEKLAQAQRIVAARNTTAVAVAQLMNLINDIRDKITGASDILNGLEDVLTAVQNQNSGASVELSNLEREARALNLSAKELAHQLDILKHSNFLGAYDSIQNSYRRSWQAERTVNGSTVTFPSIVSDSASTRHRTEMLMRARKDDFIRKNAANRRALNDLAAKVQTLNLKNINEKVCGAPGDLPCLDSPCGGAGCLDDDGTRRCGGLSCEGAVAVADGSLGRAQQSEQEIQKAMNEVEELFQKVALAKVKANEAKQRARGTLDKANNARERISHSNKELCNLINQIRNFLTQEGADPDSIEKVASQVLQLSIPASPQQIRHLAEEIKDKVSSLSNVDDILDQTADDVRRASQLLQDARRARSRAENVKNTAEAVKQALEEAGRAQDAAQTAIRQAKGDIEESDQTLNGIRNRTASAERELMEAMDRLTQLDSGINALKMKRASNNLVASQAVGTATSARDKANEAKQMLHGPLTDKYKTVHGLVDRKSGTVFSAKHKAESLRDEAKDLLRDAQDKLKRLNVLEIQYEKNEKILEDKARQLDGLEEKMKDILKAIKHQILIYNTCQ
ncbi:laminin subunit beta-2 [Hypanus sabinus]|uniref:laminin subunit beta-2 n=1 Tax=Hypanus sabinus TaxID=79690 RepID=UPI0028C4C60C|nr:laminin subunit beta-2 [Hypanus sabinus]